jgi:ribonuclease-3
MLIDRTPVLPAEWDSLRPKLGVDVPEELLKLALTHPSAVGEGIERTLYSNQRLEFLGDTVLGSVAAIHLFHQHTEWPEGLLTQRKISLVQRGTLARVARRLELGKYLILGRGEFYAGGAQRDSILSDALEAVLAAVFLSGGLAAAEAFFARWFAEELDAGSVPVPPKNLLQELTQANALGTPTYKTGPTAGTDSSKPSQSRYTSRVLLQGAEWGLGTGASKKEAETNAAQTALERVQAHLEEVGTEATPAQPPPE